MKANEYLEDSFDLDGSNDFRPWDMDLKTYTILMHIAILAGSVVPIAGLALPLFMWLSNKEESVLIDQHGKNIMNWILSSIVYAIVSCILMVVGVGFLMIFGLLLCNLIFVIMGAVKASNGEVFKYPIVIEFFK